MPILRYCLSRNPDNYTEAVKHPPTKAERTHLDRVASLGCAICGDDAEIHHIRTGFGGGQRAPDWLTIPLCFLHHRGGLGYHHSPQTFQSCHGTELNLLADTYRRLSDG